MHIGGRRGIMRQMKDTIPCLHFNDTAPTICHVFSMQYNDKKRNVCYKGDLEHSR